MRARSARSRSAFWRSESDVPVAAGLAEAVPADGELWALPSDDRQPATKAARRRRRFIVRNIRASISDALPSRHSFCAGKGSMQRILTWYQTGGPFMVPLLLVAVIGLAVLLERFSYIVLRSRINARPFIERVISLVRAGKLDEALKLCAEHQSTLPDLGLVILRSRSRDEEDLVNVAEASALSVVPAIMRRLSWLPTLSRVALLLGALGFVANLHDALGQVTAASGNDVFAAAIAYALRPLAAGMLAAIPLVLGHTFLSNEAAHIVEQLEEFTARLVNALIDRPDVRLGHRT